VFISYDGDFAGQSADLRGIDILKREGLNVRVVPMPDGLDPDDVAKQGKEAYQKCLDAAMPLVDYKLHAIERKYDLTRTEEKRAFVKESLGIVAATESSAVREDLLKKLRDKTGLTYQSLERDLEHALKEDATGTADAMGAEMKIAEVASGADKIGKAERFILAAKLFSADYAKGFSIERLHFENSVHARIAEYVADREKKGERIRPAELFEVFDENCPEFNEILDLNYEDKLTGSVAAKFFEDSVAALEKQSIDREIALLQEELSKTDEQGKRMGG
jgi:DNA primase